MGIFNFLKSIASEPIQETNNIPPQEPIYVEDDALTKWRKTDLYQEFLSKVELLIEIHIDTIKEKNTYFGDTYGRADMYCIDITERYYRLRTVNWDLHRFDENWTIDLSNEEETLLIGVSFFEKKYQNIDYIQLKGFQEAICTDLKKFEQNGIEISSHCEVGNDSRAYVWIDFKPCYKKLNSIF